MRTKHILLPALLLSASLATAQVQMQGSVQQENGRPLKGARIVLKGARDTVTTNKEGDFQLTAPALPATLLLGYGSQQLQEVKINTTAAFVVVWKKRPTDLPEVLITSATNRHLAESYDIIEIDGNRLQYTFESNPVNALRARVPGLQMTATAGGVTSGSGMVIRGMKSVMGSNQPLFVLDGMPIENETSGANQSGGQDWGNSLKELNTFDIANATVLKGAAAVARYGARGLNGVIELTTKGAEAKNGWHVEAAGGYSAGNAYSPPQLIRQEVVNETGDEKLAWLANSSRHYLQSFQQANSQLGNIAVTYGSAQSQYRLSYTADFNKGTYYGNTLDKQNIMFKAINRWSDAVRTKVGVIYHYNEARNAPSIGAQRFASLGNMFVKYPADFNAGREYDPLENETSWWLYGQQAFKRNQTLRAYLQTDISLARHLSLQAMANYSGYQTRTREHAQGYMEPLLGKSMLYHQEMAYRNFAKENTQDYMGRLQLVYERRQGNIGWKATAAYDYWTTSGNINGEAWKPADPNAYTFTRGDELRVLQQFDNQDAFIPASYFRITNANRKTIHGALAMLETDWKQKLFVNLSARMDHVNTLPSLQQLGKLRMVYPTAGVSYLLQDDLRRWFNQSLPWLSMAKLRANVGRTGNVTGLFHYMSSVSGDMELPYPSHKTLYKPYFTDNGAWGLQNYQTGFSLENAWEYELGTALRFLDDRIGVDVTWYNRRIHNRMYDIVSPLEQYVHPLRYVGAHVRNSGWEIQLNAIPVRSRHFSWNTTFNFAANRNRFDRIETAGSDQLSLGASQSDVSLVAAAQGSFGTLMSSYAQKYNDAGKPVMNGNMQYVPAGTPVKIGDATPNWIGGWENTLEYKGIRLSALLDIKMGGDVWSGTYALLYERGALRNTEQGRTANLGGERRITRITRYDPDTKKNTIVYKESFDGIIPDGVFDKGTRLFGKDVSDHSFADAQAIIGRDEKGEYLLQPLAAGDYYAGFHERAGVKQHAVLENSYIALREVALSYLLPASWMSRFRLQECRVGVTGRNLGYLYRSLPYGLNPDGAYNNRNGGAFEYASLLPIRTWGAFIQIRL